MMIQIHCIKGGIWQEKFKCITQTTFYHILLQPYKFVMSAKQVMWFTFQIRQLFLEQTNAHTHTHVSVLMSKCITWYFLNLQIHPFKDIHTWIQIHTTAVCCTQKHTHISYLCYTYTCQTFSKSTCYLLAITQMICAMVVNLMSFGQLSSIWCHMCGPHQFDVTSNDSKVNYLYRQQNGN